MLKAIVITILILATLAALFVWAYNKFIDAFNGAGMAVMANAPREERLNAIRHEVRIARAERDALLKALREWHSDMEISYMLVNARKDELEKAVLEKVVQP